MRQYEREDIDYEIWYSDWMKRLAKIHSLEELERQLYGRAAEANKASMAHLRAIEASSSMSSNSSRRAHARNTVAAAGDAAIALRGAIEIYELFPEHTKQENSNGY